VTTALKGGIEVNRKHIAILFIIIIVLGVAAYFLMPIKKEFSFSESFSSKAKTPYGESLEIKLNVGGKTYQGSFIAVWENVTQNIWLVNSTYKEQGMISFSLSLQVVGNKITDCQVENAYIKAIDTSDNSYATYVFGAYPISITLDTSYRGSWSPSTVEKTISDHLTDCGAATTCTIKYVIYVRVTAKGEESGQTLVAEIPETHPDNPFTVLNFERETEESSVGVTPQVVVSSWLNWLRKYYFYVALAAAVIVIVIFYRRGKK